MAVFVSAQQTITSGGTLTIAHGLGARPNFVDYRLECTTAELGYSIGNIVRPVQPDSNGSNGQGCVIAADATNLVIRFGNQSNDVFEALALNTKGINGLSNSSWKVRFIAVTTTGFTSADQTISGGGSFTLNHGLTATPRSVHVALVCQTAEHGYSVGDVIWNGGICGGNHSGGVIMKLTSTQIIGKYINCRFA